MEKKTIGGFIAALRKANGMTQKDLAEQLNVSDKTVSRWERKSPTEWAETRGIDIQIREGAKSHWFDSFIFKKLTNVNWL